MSRASERETTALVELGSTTGVAELEPVVFVSGEVVAGRYLIDRLLGRGGMGQVFAAEDLEVGDQVALKVIRPSIAAKPNVLDRFRQEVQLARKVTHRNVCRIFDLSSADTAQGWGDGETLRFLTMELLPGQSLAERLAAEGPLDPNEAGQLLHQIGLGLDTAHAAGVVHGDLKPANVVWIDGEQRAVVTDFGLARGLDDAGPWRAGATPAYAAPEVLAGWPVSRQADLFSFGVLAAELLTGQPARDAATLRPGPWRRLVEACLRADPDKRPRSAEEALALLGTAEAPPPVQQAIAPRPEAATPLRSRLVRFLAVAALVLTTLTLANVVSERRDPGQPAHGVDLVERCRPTVAVLGLTDSDGAIPAWQFEALAEALRLELAASQHFRVLPAEQTARMVRDLDVQADPGPWQSDQWRAIQKHSGVTHVLTGSLRMDVLEPDLGVTLQLVDAQGGRVEATSQAEGLTGSIHPLVAKAVQQLTRELGPRLTTAVAETGLPTDPEAQRLYVLGQSQLRDHRWIQAIESLEAAALRAPSSPRVHDALAAAWSLRGFEQNALEAAARAFALADNLVPEQRSLIEARYRELGRDWRQAESIYHSLRTVFPDQVDYGLRLATVQARSGRPRAALQTLDRLRTDGVSASDQIRLDLTEAEIAVDRGHFPRALALARSAATAGQQQRNQTLHLAARRTEGQALDFLGRRSEADTTYAAMGRLATATDDRLSLAKATLRRLEAGVPLNAPELPVSLEEALATFRQAGSGDLAVRTSLVSALFLASDDPVAAEDQMLEALERTRLLGHREAEAAALNYLALLASQRQDWPETERRTRQVLGLFADDGGLVEKAVAVQNLAIATYRLGHYSETRPEIHAVIVSDRRKGNHFGFGQMLLTTAVLELRSGYAQQAERFFSEALEISEDLENRKLRRAGLRARAYTFEILDAADRAAADWEALAALNHNSPEAERVQPWRARISLLFEPTRHTDAVLTSLELELESPSAPSEPAWRRDGAQLELAWAYLERGRLAECRRIVDSMAAKPEKSIWGVELVYQVLSARLLAAEGQTDEALDHLRQLRAQQRGDVLRQVFLDLAMAQVLRRDDTKAANALLSQVERRATESGFHRFARQAREAMRASSNRNP